MGQCCLSALVQGARCTTKPIRWLPGPGQAHATEPQQQIGRPAGRNTTARLSAESAAHMPHQQGLAVDPRRGPQGSLAVAVFRSEELVGRPW